jgi:hypothetical protein
MRKVLLRSSLRACVDLFSLFLLIHIRANFRLNWPFFLISEQSKRRAFEFSCRPFSCGARRYDIAISPPSFQFSLMSGLDLSLTLGSKGRRVYMRFGFATLKLLLQSVTRSLRPLLPRCRLIPFPFHPIGPSYFLFSFFSLFFSSPLF